LDKRRQHWADLSITFFTTTRAYCTLASSVNSVLVTVVMTAIYLQESLGIYFQETGFRDSRQGGTVVQKGCQGGDLRAPGVKLSPSTVGACEATCHTPGNDPCRPFLESSHKIRRDCPSTSEIWPASFVFFQISDLISYTISSAINHLWTALTISTFMTL
jgi:hypothetical protein